jgi:heat shock protein HslJ
MSGCAAGAQGQPLGQSSDLAGTEWVLISLNGNVPDGDAPEGDALIEGALIEGTAITLRFDETVIKGSGGCNTYSGGYTASEDSLSLSDVVRTEMACPEPEGVFEQEQAYFRALDAVAHYHVDGDRLELRDGNGDQVLAFVASTAALPAEQPALTETAPELSLDCTLEMGETGSLSEPVNLVFALHNPTSSALYVLTWYTPLEGMMGEIVSVTRDGEAVPYQGALVKRGDPARDAYVVIEPGETVSAVVDLRTGYDLALPGSYQVQVTAGLQDVTGDASLLPRKRDAHEPQSLACNAVGFSIAPAPEPPVGFRRYSHGPSGVFLWVPESWTVIEPAHNGSTILQSYPQDKYVGGEPRQPGDAKCGLTVHAPGTSIADLMQQLKSDARTTIVSEQEIVLNSGRPGIRLEVESMGRSRALFTTLPAGMDHERAVVLSCFGETAPFDDIAVTLGIR